MPYPNKWSKYYPYKEATIDASTNKLPKVGKGYKVGHNLQLAASPDLLASQSYIPSTFNSKLKMPQLVGSNSQSRLFQHVQRDDGDEQQTNSASRQARLIDQVLDDVFSPEKNFSKSP